MSILLSITSIFAYHSQSILFLPLHIEPINQPIDLGLSRAYVYHSFFLGVTIFTLIIRCARYKNHHQMTDYVGNAHRPPSIISGRIPDSAEYPTFHTKVLAALCPRLYMSGLQQKSHTAIL
ncbi:hypothetical protein BDB01DRAFT_893442 [Pilobolus umbonatus]|nr:hypothetical protein BDB01DRAFT_893442 [Pilobolus umbonatus]